MTSRVKGKKVLSLLEEAEWFEDATVRTYSGRGMYGNYCPAIVGSQSECVKLLVRAAMLDPDTFELYNLADFATDSMGYDVVWYWPHLEVKG